MTLTASLGLAVLVFLVQKAKNVPISGPYTVWISRGGPCDKAGTNQIDLVGKMSSRGKDMQRFSSNIRFDIPWDDTIKTNVEIQQLRNGAFTPKFVTHSFKNCEQSHKFAVETLTSLFAAAGYNFTGCPLPAGMYLVRDWKVNLTFPQVPKFVYGSYKMIISFSRDNKRVGCIAMYGDALPKTN